MRSLPLFYYSGTYLLVDDDSLMLSTLKETIIGNGEIIRLFSSPQDCLLYINDYHIPSSQYNFLSSNHDDENYGLLSRAPMDFNVTRIIDLLDNENRHNEITVMIIDYKMPLMDGISLSEKIKSFPIKKVLLTGTAKEDKVLEAFNNGLIQRFIQKASVSMHENLLNYVHELSMLYFSELTKPLLNYLETENKISLSDPVFIDFFENYCQENKIREFYLIDKQGSFLCIDENKRPSFLIIHTNTSIEQWLSIYKNEPFLTSDDERSVKERRKIPFFGLGKEAWHVPAEEWKNHFYKSSVLFGREIYFYTILREF